MRTALARLREHYGADPLHLLVLLACIALAGYTVLVIGPTALWDTKVWWQSILVWFVGAVVSHDLVLFPLYALADRGLAGAARVLPLRRRGAPRAVPALNHVRVPLLASGLLLLLFLPGIIEQGKNSYAAATGQTQDPFLLRWLLITGVFLAVSAIAYAVRLRRARPHPQPDQ